MWILTCKVINTEIIGTSTPVAAMIADCWFVDFGLLLFLVDG